MKEFFTILLAVVLALVVAVSLQPMDLAPVDEIASALQENGFAVSIEEPEENSEFLHGERYRLILNHNPETNVIVYVYQNADEACKEAKCIHADGCGMDYREGLSVGHSVQISWVDAPHFFLYKNVIVQYIGSDWEVLSPIETICGEQIAGLPYYEPARIAPGLLCMDESAKAFLRVTVAGGQPDGVIVELVNAGDEELHYGEPFKLYRENEIGGWEWINQDTVFIMPLYTLPAGTQKTLEYRFEEPLDAGTYRITKEVRFGRPDGYETEPVELRADFTIE